jgi:epoxyqueuosine reductase
VLLSSYLTIELKRPIPPDLAPRLRNRTVDCNICQEACPFNAHRAAPTEEPAFHQREVTGSSLADLQETTEEEFGEKFEGARSSVRSTVA